MQSNSLQNAQPVDPDGAAEAGNAPFKTLVVDGNHFFNGFLEAFLETEGHLILTADTAKDALAQTRQFQPDLILLDLGLDGSNGLELLGELLLEQVNAAVLVMAREPSVDQAIEAMKIGALDYLTQPLDPRKLKQTIDTQKLLFPDPHA